MIKYNDCYAELIKEVYCTKKQMLKIENEEIIKNENSVNRIMAIRSLEEKQQYQKVYQQKETVKKYQKEYQKEYQVSEKYRKYEERRKVKIDCNCGKQYTISNQARHFRIEQHKNYLSSLIQ